MLSLFARALAVVFGLFALYLIVVNTLISTPLLRSLINREGLESPRVEYASAWSFWPGRADFRGSRVDLREVRVQRGDEEPWLWQARLDLPAGELRTDRPRVFYAHIGLRAPNARPFYRLLDLKLPAWAERLLKLDQFQATADLAVGETFVDLKSLDASGGAFRILGRYHFRKASKKAGSGAFLIDAGSLALGIGLNGGEKKLQLIGARSWFRDQSRPPAGKDEASGGS